MPQPGYNTKDIVLPVCWIEQHGRMITFATTPPSTEATRAGALQTLDYNTIPDRYVRRIEWAAGGEHWGRIGRSYQ